MVPRIDALALIEKATKVKPRHLFVLAGDDDFLRRTAQQKLLDDFLSDDERDLGLSSFEGDQVTWPAVKSDLDTLPFLCERRVVVVEQGDGFVTKNRPSLEQYASGEPGRGVLILAVKSWPANTKISKMVPPEATISCAAPKRIDFAKWCTKWAKGRHEYEFVGDAADVLVELVGDSLGQLAREIEKLASVARSGKVSRVEVEKLVGRCRQAEVFKIFDEIGEGQPGKALIILARLLEQGEDPIGILGVFSWNLRRLAEVSRSVRAGLSIDEAMARGKMPPFARGGIEKQLRHLGRARMDRVYDWLLETDSGLKGGNAIAPRIQLEQLVLKLATREGTMPI